MRTGTSPEITAGTDWPLPLSGHVHQVDARIGFEHFTRDMVNGSIA
jgi:hypothetical protein